MMKTISQNDAFARSAPMVYAVVTTLDEEGKPNALGVSWVTRTSFEPFLMLISIDHSRYSHARIRKNREFVINYPGPHQKKGHGSAGRPQAGTATRQKHPDLPSSNQKSLATND